MVQEFVTSFLLISIQDLATAFHILQEWYQKKFPITFGHLYNAVRMINVISLIMMYLLTLSHHSVIFKSTLILSTNGNTFFVVHNFVLFCSMVLDTFFFSVFLTICFCFSCLYSHSRVTILITLISILDFFLVWDCRLLCQGWFRCEGCMDIILTKLWASGVYKDFL